MRFLAAIACTALALGAGAWLLDGVTLQGILPALLAAVVLGVLNALVRPVLVLLTLPITLLTLGLFLFVINAALLLLTAWLTPGLAIAGFWSSLGLAVIVTVVNAGLGARIDERK